MSETALDIFVKEVRDSWGPLSSKLIDDCSSHLINILRGHPHDQLIDDLRSERPEACELYRDPTDGFVLLAHTEAEGRYRSPHDHGESWVIYGVLDGEMEMGTYVQVKNDDTSPYLVKRGSTIVRPGEVQVYLPGDIHDTRCLKGPAIQFRFTARDLRLESSMIRYTDVGGIWVPAG